MIKGIKNEEKDAIYEFGLADMGKEISMLSEMVTLKDMILYCQKKQKKVEEKLEKFRKKEKNEQINR